MEYSKKEIEVLAAVVEKADETEVRELDQLQLAMVGGGSGDVSFV